VSSVWASDVPISMPSPPTDSVVRRYGGFGTGWFGGVVHDLSPEDVEDLRHPPLAPAGPLGGEGGSP
jgi:hypothetical protein